LVLSRLAKPVCSFIRRWLPPYCLLQLYFNVYSGWKTSVTVFFGTWTHFVKSLWTVNIMIRQGNEACILWSLNITCFY
jgi:hypothetical protein